MKERLTGAVILVALIVLLVPELLTGPIRARPASARAARIGRTVPAEPPLRTYTLTLGAASAAEVAPMPAPALTPAKPAQGATVNPPQAKATRPRAHPSLQVASSPPHSTLREAHSAASSGGWVVQLGSFASRRNADRLAHALAGRGFRISVSPARAGSRLLWRVRAGPTRDRASAGRLAARLRGLGHRGELLPVR